MNRQKLLINILDLLGKFKFEVNTSNKSSLTDINIFAEDVLIPILNEIFDANFQNANTKNKNSAAIDLYDDNEKNPICIQITSISKSEKIKDTLVKFVKYKYYYKYKKFIIIIISDKQKKYNNSMLLSSSKGLFPFSNNNIWDFSSLFNEIKGLEYNKIIKIEKFLDSQFSALKSVNKPQENIYSDNSKTIAKETLKYQNVLKFFPEMYHGVIVNSINEHDKIVAILSCAPNYRGKQYDSTKKYHLGHYYFVKLVDELLKVKQNGFSICMCPSSNYENHEDMIEFLNTLNVYWTKCFNCKVNIEKIHFFIQTQDSNRIKPKIISWLHDIESKVRTDLSLEEKGVIRNWEKTNIISEGNLLKFAKKIKITKQEITKQKITPIEIMSIFALLYKNPYWYNNDWFIQVLLSFIEGGEDNGYLQNIQHRILGTKKITIIESEKNLSGAGWEAMSLCAKHFKLGKFPDRAYFKSIPNIDIDGPMRSKDHKKAIFLSPDQSLHKLKNKKGTSKILELFSEGNHSQIDLVSLIKQGAERLSQNSHEKC